MQKNNLLFGLIGLTLGVVISYFATQYINNKPAAASESASANAQQPTGGPPAQVMAVITKARNEPENFEAQTQAAALYKQINGIQPRADFVEKEIEFLNRALKLKPNEEAVILNLTNVLLEKGDKAEAQKTFQQLEKIKPATPELKQQRDELLKRIKAS